MEMLLNYLIVFLVLVLFFFKSRCTYDVNQRPYFQVIPLLFHFFFCWCSSGFFNVVAFLFPSAVQQKATLNGIPVHVAHVP